MLCRPHHGPSKSNLWKDEGGYPGRRDFSWALQMVVSQEAQSPLMDLTGQVWSRRIFIWKYDLLCLLKAHCYRIIWLLTNAFQLDSMEGIISSQITTVRLLKMFSALSTPIGYC